MPRRMTDGQVVARAVMYAQIDHAERRPFLGPLVLQEQVRVMERIGRLEEYLAFLTTITRHHVNLHNQARVAALDNRFVAAHQALIDIERMLPS